MNQFLSRLREHSELSPRRVFCQFVTPSGVNSLHWRDFEVNVAAYAHRLIKLRCDPSRRVVLIFLKHTPHLYWSFFGAMFAGLVPSFMPCLSPKQDPELYWKSHAQLLRHIDPAAIIADAETLAEMQANGLDIEPYQRIDVGTVVADPLLRLPEPSSAPESLALLQHSSGTTGLKKGVALTYGAIVSQLESYSTSLSIDASDTIVSWLPVYHDMGLVACLLLPAYCRIPLVHMDAFHWLARPGTLLDHITTFRGTLCWLPNFAFEHIARTFTPGEVAIELNSMRAFINCSEPCKPATFDRFLDRFRAFGVDETKLQVCYAMAETVFAVSQTTPGKPVRRFMADIAALQTGKAQRAEHEAGATSLLSAGREIAGMEVHVLGPDRAAVPEQTIGELALTGSFLFSGYFRNHQLSKTRFFGDLYCTGDLGFLADGEVYVIGRTDDLMIINGKNIYAHEVESIVSAAVDTIKPGRAVAIPVFNEKSGSDVLVLVAERATGPGADSMALARTVSEAVYSELGVKPWQIRLVPEGWLVKTTSGKISRKENKSRYVQEFLAKR